MDKVNLPEYVDKLHTLRQARLAADKESRKLKKQEDDVNAFIIAEMREKAITEAHGELLVVELDVKEKGSVEDWDALWSYIRENDAFELLHKRLTDSAVKERWDAGEEVPGVEKVDVYKLILSTI